MNETLGRSVGPSSRYTVLALNVAKLARSLPNRTVEPIEAKLLIRAAEFVKKIIEGSLFVEGRDAHCLTNARESLFTVDHAISALRQLKIDPEAKQLTEIFKDYEKDLRALAAGEQIEANRVASIRNFFDALASRFYRDVADSAFTPQMGVPRG